MTNLLLSVFLLLVVNSSCSTRHKHPVADYFEGAITFKGDFIMKTDKYDSSTLALMAGQETIFYAKEGDYLTVTESGLTTRILYRKKENRYYRERFNSDSVYWTRCDKPGQKVLSATKKANAEKILGIECDELKFFYDNRTVTYYYNPDTLKINPDWYKNSTSYNENIYSQEMKSVALKSIIEYKDFIIIQSATDIKKQKLGDSLFEVPKKPLVEDN